MASQNISQNYLYLYDLPRSVTKTKLCEIIKSKTELQLEREPQIRRDLIRPFYSAIISINDKDKLKEAALNLRYFEIDNKPCRALQFDNQLLGTNVTKIQENNLFVRKINKNTSAPELEKFFEKYGKIKSLKIALNEDHSSRGYGFVCFEDSDKTKEALEKTGDAEENQSHAYKPRDCRAFRKAYNNIYVKNLPVDFDEEKVKEMFTAYGRIESLKVGNNDKGAYAFVCYSSEDKADREYGPMCAQKAVEALHDKEIEEGSGKKLYVREALKKTERALERQRDTLKYKNSKKRCNLYVKSFPENTTEEQLRDIFSDFGDIESLRLFSSPTDETIKLYAFVCYKTPDMAIKAKQELSGRPVFGGKPLYINFYEIKEVRALQNEEARDKQDYKMYQAEHAMSTLDNINREELMQRLYQLLACMPQLKQQVGGQFNRSPQSQRPPF